MWKTSTEVMEIHRTEHKEPDERILCDRQTADDCDQQEISNFTSLTDDRINLLL